MSVITPPNVTQQVLESAIQLGIRHVWIQPGAEHPEAIQKALAHQINVVYGGDCVLVMGLQALQQASKL